MCSGRGGQPGEAVESAWFRRGIGMEGDRHAAEVKGRLRCWREKPGLDGEADRTGLCFRRYKANLITEE